MVTSLFNFGYHYHFAAITGHDHSRRALPQNDAAQPPLNT
jgi:hypothetical protein